MQIKKISLKVNELELEGINFNHLTLLIGANGTGKSLVLKMNFFTVMLFNVAKLMFGPSTTANPESFLNMLTELLNDCFVECDFTGKLEAVMQGEKGEICSGGITYENGKVTDAYFNDLEAYKEIYPLYMSSEARLFMFLQSCILRIPKEYYTETKTVKRSEMLFESIKEQPTYNKMYVDLWMSKLPFEVDDQIKARLISFDFKEKDIPQKIYLDDDKILRVKLVDGSSKALTRYSNGEQALINMLLTTSLVPQN